MKNESMSIQTNEEIKETLKKIADGLNMPSNTFIKTHLNLSLLENYKLSNDDIDNFIDDYSTNPKFTFTSEFKSRIKDLISDAKKETLKFFLKTSLMPGIVISSNKNCNFYIKDIEGVPRFLFYMGILVFKSKDIEDYIIKYFKIDFATVGEQGKPGNEYVWISAEEQFKNSKIHSEKFEKICKELKLSSLTSIIKVHYTILPKLYEILKKL